MKYDEFVDKNDKTKYNETIELMYDFGELGIDPETGKVAGFADGYNYLAPRKDVEAVMKSLLVHEENMSPEAVTEDYLKRNFGPLFDKYGNKINDAFLDDARERAVVEVDNGFVKNADRIPGYTDGETKLMKVLVALNEKYYSESEFMLKAHKDEKYGEYRIVECYKYGNHSRGGLHEYLTKGYKDIDTLITRIKADCARHGVQRPPVELPEEVKDLDYEVHCVNQKYFFKSDNRLVPEKNENTGMYRVMMEWREGEKAGKPRVMMTSEFTDAYELIADMKKNAKAGAYNNLAEYESEKGRAYIETKNKEDRFKAELDKINNKYFSDSGNKLEFRAAWEWNWEGKTYQVVITGKDEDPRKEPKLADGRHNPVKVTSVYRDFDTFKKDFDEFMKKDELTKLAAYADKWTKKTEPVKESEKEDPLRWRPKKRNDPIPSGALEARLSRLSVEDAKVVRESAENNFAQGFLYKYMGGKDRIGDAAASELGNELTTLYMCATISKDADQALRIFRSSAQYNPARDDAYGKAAKDAFEDVSGLRKKTAGKTETVINDK